MSFFKSLFGTSKKPEVVDPSTDVTHINQEVYKKSAELSERNKTLALLQRINELILSSITHPDEIARLVTSVLMSHADFQIATIFLYDSKKRLLRRIAYSEVDTEGNAVQRSDLYLSEISFSAIDNLVIQSVNDKRLKVSPTLENVLLIPNNSSASDALDHASIIKSVFSYPLSVRSELIGAMVIGMKQGEESVSEYRRDMLNRLADTVGIAMDNALLYNEVQSANARLKELDKLKDEFVSLASHELRTPMTAIKSYLWMALDGQGGPLNEKQRYYIDRAYMSVDRLTKMVNDMLNISRIESGRLSIDVNAVSLDKVIKDVIEEVTPRAKEVGVTISLEVPGSLPQAIVDEDKIKEVIFNLLGNALKFTPKDGKITISLKQKDTMIETTVSDNGVGINKEEIPKLFQKFSMIADSYGTDKPVTGTGLGLYICRSIIEMHEGKIWATSEGLGKGTQVTFSLKIFNEDDFKRLTEKFSHNIKENVDLVHAEI